MSRLAPLALALAIVGACAGPGPAVPPDVDFGVQIAQSEAVVDFYAQASAFYSRLARRRFNSRATYRDERLRGFFSSESAFADYYADLAQALFAADFERSRPLSLDVVEFSFDAPGRARVQVRMVGDDSRPLRFGQRILDREDRWERQEGRWTLVPGKI